MHCNHWAVTVTAGIDTHTHTHSQFYCIPRVATPRDITIFWLHYYTYGLILAFQSSWTWGICVMSLTNHFLNGICTVTYTLPPIPQTTHTHRTTLTLLRALWFCLSISSGVFLLPNSAARAILVFCQVRRCHNTMRNLLYWYLQRRQYRGDSTGV